MQYIGSVFLVGAGIIYGHYYKYYHHIAAAYGQNKHARANLRRIVGLEMVGRVLWGSYSPVQLRAAAKLTW